MPAATNRATHPHDFVWAIIDSGEYELLKSVCPTDFNFSSLDTRASFETRGQTILQSPLINYLASNISIEQDEKYISTISWLIEHGADPTQVASSDCDFVASIWKSPEPGQEVTEDDKVKVEYSSQTAIEAILEFKEEFAFHIKDREWAERHIEKCDLVIAEFSKFSRSKARTSTVPVSEPVVDLWDQFYKSCEGRDVTISANEGAQVVKAHSTYLCLSSHVLKAMLHSGLKESQNKTITVDGKLADGTLDLFVELLYCGSSTQENRSCQAVLDLLDLSHRWQIPHICKVCERWLTELVDENNVEAITEASLLKEMKDLQMVCRLYVEGNEKMMKDYEEGKLCSTLSQLIKPAEEAVNEPPRKKRRY